MVANIDQYSTAHIAEMCHKDNNFLKEKVLEELPPEKIRKKTIIWTNVFYIGLIHIFAIYGFYLSFTSMKFVTVLYGLILAQLGTVATMAGSHRLWTHRSYKAKWPLRLLLIIFTTIAYQKSSFEWARDHRLHHKYSETDSDPHNSKRGFFFSHIGWVFEKRHPDLINNGKKIDVSDLLADPFVRFQHMNYWILPVGSFIIPAIIPMICWNETFINAVCLNFLRFIICLHCTFSINSFAHLYGNRPYDRNIEPRENSFVAAIAGGEGWHNYHHAFPWDYRAAEFGKLNLTYHFINFFAKVGWAYDLKTVPDDLVKSRMRKTGES